MVELLEQGGDDFHFDDDVNNILADITEAAAMFECEQQLPLPVASRSVPAMGTTSRYGSPKGNAAVEQSKADGVPTKTKGQTKWAVGTWSKWAAHRNQVLLPGEFPFEQAIEILSTSSDNKENFTKTQQPIFNISGGSNVTIHFGCSTKP